MASDDEREVPAGAAVFPLIPPELGVHPLLLALLHAAVFLVGSEDEVVDGAAAEEALDFVAGYVQRLEGRELERVQADLQCLVAYAQDEKWPKGEIQFLKSFLTDF